MKRILGIDYGTKKIGIALGVGAIVQPYLVIDFRAGHALEKIAIKTILKIVHEEMVNLIVIGLPILNGVEAFGSNQIREFGNKLKNDLSSDVEIKYVDEFGTSKSSSEIAVKAGISQKRRKNDHALAACQIIKWSLPNPEV